MARFGRASKSRFLDCLWRRKRRNSFDRLLHFQRSQVNIYFNLGLEININRYKFIEDLTKFENTSLDRTVSVRFDGEPGIDAGGLRREFYDLVGAQLKN
jgi:hypothetical protein